MSMAATALTMSMKESRTAASDWKRRSERKIHMTTPAIRVSAVKLTA